MADARTKTYPTRITRVLNDFIGHVHAARCSQAIWLRVHDDPRYRIAAKYGLQAAFGVIALTLRKFEDFYAEDFHRAIPDKSKRPAEAKWLLQESQKRHLRDAANKLIAHYKDRSRQIPSASEIEKLIERGGLEYGGRVDGVGRAGDRAARSGTGCRRCVSRSDRTA